MSENMSEKTANKTYWWRFNHEHARHTRHFKPIYWGLFSVGVIFAMMWHGVHRFYYLLHDLHYHIGNRFRNVCYLVTIAIFALTLYAGWF